MTFLTGKKDTGLEWPSQSPNLNSLENMIHVEHAKREYFRIRTFLQERVGSTFFYSKRESKNKGRI